MQFPIMNGVYADLTGAPRTSYPRNLIPVPKKTGVSDGFLQPGDGLVQYDNGVPGVDRGGINWNGQLYRVLGSKLCFVDTLGNVSVIGDVGNDGNPVFMDYSFTYLAIASNGNLFYYDGVSNFFQVTDPKCRSSDFANLG